MAHKRTTESKSPSKTEGLPQYNGLDSEMPQLDDNDCWLWQTVLEAMIRRNVPDDMNGRYLSMLRVLCAQARRANIPPEDNGAQ